MRLPSLLLLVAPVLLAGCASTRRVEPVPESAWRAAADSPRTREPVVRRGDAARPRPSGEALAREQVLDLATRLEAQEAIAEIDRHPLAFALTQENLGWFEDRVAPPEVVDYLKKRSAVDWEKLAGPAEPEAPTYEPPAPRQTTVYVEAPPPRTTVVYVPAPATTYYYSTPAPYYVGGYYGRSYVPCRTTYVAPRTTYVYTRPACNTTVTYRPGVPAGVFAQPVVRHGAPTVIVRRRCR